MTARSRKIRARWAGAVAAVFEVLWHLLSLPFRALGHILEAIFDGLD